MQQHALAAVFTIGMSVAPASAVWAQDGELQPLNPDLIPAEPFDGCIDSLGEMMDFHAYKNDIPPMLLRNLYRDIIDEATANTDPNTPEYELIDVPPFNQQLEYLSPDLQKLMGILFRDPLAAQTFGMGCDLDA